AVFAANRTGSAGLRLLVGTIPSVRSRRDSVASGPESCTGARLTTIVNCGIGSAIEESESGSRAKGIESSQHLGGHRRVIERTIAWLGGYHRLSIRYDSRDTHVCAFLTLAS